VIAALAVEPHQRREHFSEESSESEFDPSATATQTATMHTTVPSVDHDAIDTTVLPDSDLQASFDETESAESTTTPSDRIAAASPYEVIDQPLGNEFRAIQIHDCYIVVASEAGLEVIDQHALHERILYEHLRNRILAGGVERQRLLIPDTIECTATECVALLESLDLLKEIGFELQEFGGTTILLMSHPTLIPRGNLARIVKDFAEQLVQNDGKMSRRDLLDHMLHTMACKAAIKSGHRLTPEEMQELLRQRHLVDDSHHCPHGRPTSLTLSRGTLDQQFGRLG
jgi:DNA mismatch repair protein MutL